MSFGPRYDSDIPEGHGWAETSDRCPRDRLLRACGFTIHSRRRGLPALWQRQGKVWTELEAIEEAAGNAGEEVLLR